MILDIYIAMEESYKNGYRKGCEDTKKEIEAKQKRGRWLIHSNGKGDHANNWAECPNAGSAVVRNGSDALCAKLRWMSSW